MLLQSRISPARRPQPSYPLGAFAGPTLKWNRSSRQAIGLISWLPDIYPDGAQDAVRRNSVNPNTGSSEYSYKAFPEFGTTLNSLGAAGSGGNTLHFDYDSTVTSLLSTQATISAWVKLNEATPAAAGDTGCPLHFGNNGGFATHYPYTDGTVYCGTFTTSRFSFSPSASVIRTDWHLLTITSSPTGWNFYQNAQLVSTAGGDATISVANPYIAGSVTGYNFSGQMCDVRIYNRVLNQTEVYSLYNPSSRWELYWTGQRPKIFKKQAASATAFPEFYYRMMRS